jgi:hypothetical protein
MPTHDSINLFAPGRLHGQVDGPDDGAVPLGGFVKTHGFEFRRGYASSCKGREKKTSSEIVASKRVRAGCHWERPNGDSFNWVVCDGRLLQESTAGNFSFSTIRNLVTTDATSATLTNGTDLAFSARIQETIASGTSDAAPGDYFYFTGGTDGIGSAVQIASASTTTAALKSAYGGGQTSGAFKIWRKITGTEVSLVPADGRLWVFDGVRRPQWYGWDDGTSTGTDVYRECGVAPPSTPPAIALANDANGQLDQSSNYLYGVAYEDAMGTISNVAWIHPVTTAAAAQKATLSSFPKAPDYVTRVRIYRSKGFTSEVNEAFTPAYHIVKDLDDLQLKSSGTTVLVLDDDCQTLTTDAHIGRYVDFANGTTYRITDNSTTSITISGDASGESATDYISITGGFDYDTLAAGTWVDFCADGDLDTDNEAPTKNDRPPTGLKYPILFRGGGRFSAFRDGEATAEKTQTQTYITGRSPTAPTQTAEAANGENELDYWPSTHLHAGLQDGYKIKGHAEIGSNLYCFKQKGIWRLYQEPEDIDYWQWFPVRGAESVGCISPKTIVARDKVCYFLGHDAQELDIIQFNGRKAFGMFREVDPALNATRLRRTFDDFTSYTDEATAAMFQGRLYVSFPGTTGATTNDRTLRWDFRTSTADVQPWGCGVFFNTYQSSDSHILLCGDPGNLGNVFSVLGTAQDSASNIVRELISGEVGVEPDMETRLVKVAMEVRLDNGTDLAVVSYSTDGLLYSDTSKTWTDMTGKAWPSSTAGLYTVLRDFTNGPVNGSCMFKVSSTDARTWDILKFKVLHDPREQKQRRS